MRHFVRNKAKFADLSSVGDRPSTAQDPYPSIETLCRNKKTLLSKYSNFRAYLLQCNKAEPPR